MGENPSDFVGPGDLPVDRVSWFDLLHFCNRLSELQGFRPCYFNIDSRRDESAEWDRSANGYRLLTEKEWEYIARANRTFEYSGSDDPNAVAWYAKNSGDESHIAGTKQENSFGTYDQSGNLWEWCWDLSVPNKANRVLRGGGWGGGASVMRAADRSGYGPSDRDSDGGGRLARSPDPLIP
jgi:sulfatase modifying factor 1